MQFQSISSITFVNIDNLILKFIGKEKLIKRTEKFWESIQLKEPHYMILTLIPKVV